MEDLLKEKNLTLDTALTKCCAHEVTKCQRAKLTGATPESSIRAVHRKQQDSSITHREPRCPRCGSSFHPGGRRQCPAYQLVCHLCHRTGHFTQVCRSRKPAQPQTQEPAINAVHTTPSINTSRAGTHRAPTIQAEISTCNGSADLQVLPDSGADISICWTKHHSKPWRSPKRYRYPCITENMHGTPHPPTNLSTTHQSPTNHIICNIPTSNFKEPNRGVLKRVR